MLATSSGTLTRAPAGSSLATWYSGAASAWPRRRVPVGDDGLAASHRGLIEDPAPVLHEQLDYLEDLATGIAHLRAAGFGVSAIVHELFGGEAVAPGGTATWRDLSSGEFSSARWVRAFLRRDGALSAL